MRHRRRRALLVLIAFVLVAQAAAGVQPVIEQGREKDLLGLLAPHTLGKPVTPEYRLWDVRIESTQVHVGLRGPEDRDVDVLRLVHPSSAPGAREKSASFAIVRTDAGASGPAAAPTDALAKAIQQNDKGGFWRVERELSPPGAAEQIVGLGFRAWLSDGLVLYLLIAALAIALAARSLAGAPRWMTATLIAISVAGLVLRWLLAPETALGAWPYSRLYAHARLTVNGPALALVSKLLNRPIYLTEIISAMTLAYAALAPLAVFVAARRLLDDPRTALAAAGVIAFLPQHIRFSAAEDGGLPSLTVAALAVALVLVWLQESSRAWRALSLISLAPLLLFLFELRPLNNAYALLLMALPLLPKSPGSRLARGTIVAVCGVLAVYGAFMLAKEAPTATRQGLSPSLLVSAFQVFFSPRLNTLINPWVTPPLALAMAVLGAVALWKAERRMMLAWLLVWAFGFFLVHSVVTEPTMQPRYHLPLTIPLALLAGRGLSRLFEWKRPAGIAGVVYLAAAPLMHLGFIRDVDYTDLHEYAFLMRMRDVIPAGCLVVEYAGQHAADARIPRIGAFIEQGVLKNRWRSRAVVQGESVPSELAAPTGCVHLYQGLPCVSVKPAELPIAPECRALSDAAPLTRVDGAELEAHAYNSGALGDLARTGGRVTISLDRVGRSR